MRRRAAKSRPRLDDFLDNSSMMSSRRRPHPLDRAKLFYIDPSLKEKGDISTRLRSAGFEVAEFLHGKVDVCVTDKTAGSTPRSAVTTPKLSSRRHRQLLVLQQSQAAPEEKTAAGLANQLGVNLTGSSEVMKWLNTKYRQGPSQVCSLILKYVQSALLFHFAGTE